MVNSAGFLCLEEKSNRYQKMRFKIIAIGACLGLATFSFGQEPENPKKPIHVGGSVGATNNGISLIPNFSLGKPAAMFNLSVGKGRLSFESDFNFSFEAKPWYILYWLRYKVVDGKKFKLGAATHLGLNFKPTVVEIGLKPENTLLTERYWVGEIFPRYTIRGNSSIGIYYMHSRGLDPGTVDKTHFITLNANIPHLTLFKDVYLGVNPQLYYLKQGAPDGYYFTCTFTLGKDNFPITMSSLINQDIQTEIEAGKGFLWNVGVRYAFGKP